MPAASAFRRFGACRIPTTCARNEVLTAAGPVRPELTSADKGKARKVIGAHPKLTRATKTVGILLVEHYNIKTHRCDPSLGRLARLAAVNERTVRRALDALRQVGIRSDRHGGRYLTNGYIFDWNLIRFLVVQFESRVHEWWCSNKPDNSVTQERTIPSAPQDRSVHQNLEKKPERETFPTKREATMLAAPSAVSAAQGPILPNSRNVAVSKAEARWSADLLAMYVRDWRTYARFIEFITPTDSADATAAEMKCRGGGLRLLQDRVLRRGHR